MSKTSVDANVDAVLPSTGWPGHPNNVTLQTALDDLKNFAGGNPVAVTNAMSPYTVDVTDNFLIVDASGGAVTLNLPAVANADGRTFVIKKTDVSINAVTLQCNGAEEVDGNNTDASIDAQYDSLTIYCDGNEYLIIASTVV